MEKRNLFPFKIIMFFSFLFLFIFPIAGEGQTAEPQADSTVSLSLVFHGIGKNMFSALTWNYGLNFIEAGLGTWACIETGFDWNWRNVAYNNSIFANAGLPMLFSGYVVPVITPVAMYIGGRLATDTKLQIAGIAVAQAFVLTQAVHVPFKMVTGRTMPGVISGVFFEPGNRLDDRVCDFSGEFNWFKFDVMDGWPSGHTACAFSAAAVIADIYDDRPFIKFGVYTYAVLMGLGVALNAHWPSDSIAGALIGYAIGKAVAKSFNQLLGKGENQNKLLPYFTGNTAGVLLRL